MGVSTGTSKLYRTVVSVFAESFLLFVVNSLLFLVSSTVGSYLSLISYPALAQSQVSIVFFAQCLKRFSDGCNEQVIAPFLLTLRIAKETTFKQEHITTGAGGTASVQFFRSQGQSTLDCPTVHDPHPVQNSIGVHEEAPGGPDVGAENAIEEVPR